MSAANMQIAAAVFTGLLLVWLVGRRFLSRAPDAHPARAAISARAGLGGKLLSVPIILAAMMGLLAAWLLVFVAFVCFFYTVALAHGEVAMLMKTLPPTAGNLLFHTTFPMQTFIMGLFILLLVTGAFQIVVGPIPAARFVFMRMTDVRDLAGKLAGLLAIVAALELARTVVAGAIVDPAHTGEFFAANDQTPLTDPVGLALLACAVVFTGVLVLLASRRKP